MSFKFKTQLDDTKPPKTFKFEWYWSPVFCAIWFAIFYVAVIPSFYSFPKLITINDEQNHVGEFIGERAENLTLHLSLIGVKVPGTDENEVRAVELLTSYVQLIKENARLDLYDIDMEIQFSSGEFMLWGMPTVYHNVQNVIVKIGPKGSTSTSYLLVNSHFDSTVGSPAAGDAGVMIAIMMETLRAISISETPLENPVVFLFNGAEEIYLQGAHGFITQHKWADNCKAVINLDSAGSGGREILFQSGPNHPWLMKYYGKSVSHPYALTLAEELFQNGFIPSDTDFRIFRDHKGVPGLDMAHSFNGYVYHTKYDRFSVIPTGTYQSTGDNILALTRALANAPELEDPEKYSEGHTVFYDYLGWFTIYYTEGVGVAINVTASVCALLSIVVAFLLMIKQENYGAKQCCIRFAQIFGVQVLTVIAAIGLTLLMAVIVDAMGLQLSWYKDPWMIFGLYFSPMFFALGIIPAFYLGWTKKTTEMSLWYSVKLVFHSHAIILVFITLLMTGLGIRSAFLPMIGVFFYTISTILGLAVTNIFKKDFLWLPIHLTCQVPSFWFYTYMTYTFFTGFNAMQGRNGPASKPELFVSGITAIMCALFAGFIIPILNFFRKPKIFFSLFAVVTVIFVIIAATPAGFPFKKNIAPKRFFVIHTHRVFHEYGGQVIRNETGFYVQPVDPRNVDIDNSVYKNANSLSYTQENCEQELFCGVPLFSTRWLEWINHGRWIPAGKPNLPETTKLELTSKSNSTSTNMRFEFVLTGADRMVIYLDPIEGSEITDWSFNGTPLDENLEKPYFFWLTFSLDRRPLDFWLELEHNSENWEGPTFRLSVGGHMQYHESYYTQEYKDYLESFPDWSYPTAWIASHESWYF